MLAVAVPKRNKLQNIIVLTPKDGGEKKALAICHCNCPERAEMFKEAIAEKMNPAQIIVLNTAGVSTMYANDGGIIVAV